MNEIKVEIIDLGKIGGYMGEVGVEGGPGVLTYEVLKKFKKKSHYIAVLGIC